MKRVAIISVALTRTLPAGRWSRPVIAALRRPAPRLSMRSARGSRSRPVRSARSPPGVRSNSRASTRSSSLVRRRPTVVALMPSCGAAAPACRRAGSRGSSGGRPSRACLQNRRVSLQPCRERSALDTAPWRKEAACRCERSSLPDKPFVVETPALVAQDDFVLGATLYRPKAGRVGTVIVHGATAVPARATTGASPSFARAPGLRVLTYDYRGIGGSRPGALRGFRARHERLGAARRRRCAPARARALSGRAGGDRRPQLRRPADRPARRSARRLRGALLVGAQLGYYGHWPTRSTGCGSGSCGARWCRTLTASFGYLPGQAGLGEDLPRGVARRVGALVQQPGLPACRDHPDARARLAALRSADAVLQLHRRHASRPRAPWSAARAPAGAQLEHRQHPIRAFRRRSDRPLRLLPAALRAHAVARGRALLNDVCWPTASRT